MKGNLKILINGSGFTGKESIKTTVSFLWIHGEKLKISPWIIERLHHFTANLPITFLILFLCSLIYWALLWHWYSTLIDLSKALIVKSFFNLSSKTAMGISSKYCPIGDSRKIRIMNFTSTSALCCPGNDKQE